jgi:hypothetical protein
MTIDNRTIWGVDLRRSRYLAGGLLLPEYIYFNPVSRWWLYDGTVMGDSRLFPYYIAYEIAKRLSAALPVVG